MEQKQKKVFEFLPPPPLSPSENVFIVPKLIEISLEFGDGVKIRTQVLSPSANSTSSISFYLRLLNSNFNINSFFFQK